MLFRSGEGIAARPAQAGQYLKRAAELFEARCKQQDRAACVEASWAYQNAVGVAQDRERARALAMPACQDGYVPACRAAAEATRVAPLSISDHQGWEKSARAPLEKACSLGDIPSCVELSECEFTIPERERSQFRGRGSKLQLEACAAGTVAFCEPTDARLKKLAAACQAGDAMNCAAFVQAASKKQLDRSDESFTRLAVRGCELGDAALCVKIIGEYCTGNQTRLQSPRIERSLHRACLRADADACNALATARPGDTNSFQYFVRACELGLGSSCWSTYYFEADGVSERVKTELVGRACRLGERAACHEWGRIGPDAEHSP
jgi:TPR repeat protein